MGLILRLSAAALLLAHAVAAHAGYRVAPEPAFVVVDAVPAASDSGMGKDGTRYLLASEQIDTRGPRPVRYRRVSYVVESERGLAEAGRFSIAYQPDYQSVTLHRIAVVRDGVVQDRIADAQVQELRREEDLESGILDGEHTLNVTIPDVQVGDRVDYSFSIAGANPVFGDTYFAGFTASYSDPVGLRRVRATWPADRPLHWRVSRPGFTVRSGALGDARFVDIAASRLPRVREEDGTPSGHDAYGRIEIGSIGSWSYVVRWALPLYGTRFRDRDMAERMAASLDLRDTDKLGVLSRATAFVQGSIRYTALDMGENSHAPNRPETTLGRRFGDCKDKAVLLVALLHEAGIRADPVLVNTSAGRYLAQRMPAAQAFDHVVVRALVEGRDYWIDATRDREQGPMASRDPVPFKLGLPLCEGCRDLVEIPDPMPAQPRVAVSERIDLSVTADGYKADFGVDTDYRGLRAADTRDTFDDEGADEMGRRYLRYMRDFYKGIEAVAPPSLEASGAEGTLRTRERYRLAWKRTEGTVFGVVLFQLLDFVPKFDAGPRQAPVALSGPRLATQTVRVAAPSGWSIDPETDELDSPYFSLRRTVRVVDGLLEVRAEWRRLADEVPAADHARVRMELEKARDLLEYDVELDSRPLFSAFDSPRAWLWPLLVLLSAAFATWLAWRARTRSRLAGMLFRPTSTMQRILDAPARPTWIWGLLLAAAAMESILTVLPDQLGKGFPVAASMAAIAVPVLLLRLLLSVVLLRWALRAVRVRADFDRLLASMAWGAGPPMVVFSVLALAAVGARVVVLADAHIASPQEAPGVVLAGVLMAVGSVWALATLLSANAVAARTSRSRVAGAWALIVLLAGVLVGGIILLVGH